jgi:hypothetical protein
MQGDAMADKAGPAGGKADPSPQQDHGFMYSRSFYSRSFEAANTAMAANAPASDVAAGRRKAEWPVSPPTCANCRSRG